MNPYEHIPSRCRGPFAMEGAQVFGAKGIAPDTGHEDPDPDWLPI